MSSFSDQVVSKVWQWLGITIAITVVGVVFICINRLYFHPLAKIPGPFLGRLTNLYGAYHAWKGDYHEDILKCHVRYGNHVRYAPNRVLFNTAAGFKDIYSHQSNVIKSDVYNQMVHRAANILTLRDKTQHGVRRRILSQGFSENALRGFEPAILAQIEKFTTKIAPWETEIDGKWSHSWNMSRECDYLAFDMMADVVFSGSYNTIEKPENRHIISSIEASNVRISVLIQAAKLRFARLDKKLFPAAITARNTFVSFVSKMLVGRLSSQKSDYKDILSLVQKAQDPETGEKFGPKEVAAESSTLIVAGSDTTSTTMAALLFYLSRYPTAYRLATQEVRSTFSSASEIRAGPKLNSCTYLRACIDEAMRISPPVGGSLWREVDIGGAIIDGIPIPAGVDVGTGIYALHHNPVLYSEPEVYKPERWLRAKGGANLGAARADSGALAPYSPFSVGPRSCIGKPLALMELMLTMATLLYKFDLRDEDERWHVLGQAEKDGVQPGLFRLKDHVTSAKDGPMLQFALREGS